MTARALLTGLAVALLAAGPAGAARRSAEAERIAAYVVPADGTTITSLTKSVAGRQYTVQVSGVYKYDSGNGLADCGYFSRPGDPLRPWISSAQFRINGVAMVCGPYNESHVYTFEFTGTGGELVFDVFDGGGSQDNAGALVVRVTPLV